MLDDLFRPDPLPVWLAAAALAALFSHAALAKWADLALLEQHLAAYGLPYPLLRGGALALASAESIAAALLLTPWRSAAALLALALLVFYAAAMGWHRWHGHALDCGCGGRPLPVSWALVLRNLALAGLAGVAAATPDTRALGLGDFAVVAAALPLAALLYAAFDELARRPSPRRTTHA